MGEMLYYVRKIFYSKGGIDHSQSSFISVIKYTHGQIFYYLRKISFQKPTLYRPHSTELICTPSYKNETTYFFTVFIFLVSVKSGVYLELI